MVSITNTNPIKISNNSCLDKIAIVPIVAPRQSDPVSPINIFAGLALKTKNPNIPPTNIKQNNPISKYPYNNPVLYRIIPKVVIEITERSWSARSKVPFTVIIPLSLYIKSSAASKTG